LTIPARVIPLVGVIGVTAIAAATVAGRDVERERLTNSIGMELVRIQPGSFSMGEANEIPPEMREDIEYSTHGDWDEHPVHRVTITEPYYLGVTEVTLEQYRAFKPDFRAPDDQVHVSGINWHEAQAFCEWLSRKEGVHYRLPTEAEWEFAARAGTTSLFSSGSAPPEPGSPNAWGVKNMHSGVAERVSDWYGAYTGEDESDPIGPAAGLAKVIRGGGLDLQTPYYARSANRASYAPAFPPPAAREAQASLGESLPPRINRPRGPTSRSSMPISCATRRTIRAIMRLDSAS
jgi:formylglycine-generating enzyme required for sulfatase activity